MPPESSETLGTMDVQLHCVGLGPKIGDLVFDPDLLTLTGPRISG